MTELWHEPLPQVWCIDVSYPAPQCSCCYLIKEHDSAALVDCGAKNGVSTIMETLAAQNIRPEEVQWLIVTHAHLDHAGAAGHLMQLLPNATLAGHPTAVKHLVNPNDKLSPGVRLLYGDEWFDKHYGDLLPIAAARTRELEDGDTITLGAKRQLTALHTQGHAWHHLSIYDETSNVFYAGDAYGVSYYRQENAVLIIPVMPPTQFNPPAMEKSLLKLQELNASWAALAHYGVIPNTAALASRQIEIMHQWMTLAESVADEKDFITTLKALLHAWLKKSAAAQGLDENDLSYHNHDLHLSAAGFAHWINKHQKLKNIATS